MRVDPSTVTGQAQCLNGEPGGGRLNVDGARENGLWEKKGTLARMVSP